MKSFNCILLIVSICYLGFGAILLVQILQHDSQFYSDQGRWTLVWDDDFNAPVLDRTKWMVGDQSSDYNSYQKEIHAISARNVAVKNGHLILASDDISGRGVSNPYYTIRLTSGQVATKSVWKYGRFEIRAKIPPGIGLLSDISLRTTEEKILHEILMTMISGQDAYTVIMSKRWGTSQLRYLQEDYFSRSFLDSPANFHTFAIEWEPRSIKWYVDDHKVYQTNQYVPEVPLSLTLDTTAGNVYLYYITSKLDKTLTLPGLPQFLIVDWVRVYQRR